jgi:hypothetical protein
MKEVIITMYRWEGSRYGFTITSECEECDVNTGILNSMKEKEFKGKDVKVITKPWLNNMWKSLIKGVWHAPVVLVNGKMFSQGIFIDRKRLASLIDVA